MKLIKKVLSKIYSLSLFWGPGYKEVSVEEFLQRTIILEHPFRVITMFLFTLALFLVIGVLGAIWTFYLLYGILTFTASGDSVVILIAMPISAFGFIVEFAATSKFALEIHALLVLLFRKVEATGVVEKIEVTVRTGKNWKSVTKHCTVKFRTLKGEEISLTGTNSDGFWHDTLEQEIQESMQLKIIYDPKNPEIARMIHAR